MSRLQSIIGDRVVNNNMKEVSVKSFCGEGTVIGLYFSASWCPPCQMFTPKLAKFYKTVRKKGENFEIVFLSSDKDEEGFCEYMQEMPWLALPFGDSKIEQLSEKYEITGIPNLILLDGKSGEVITKYGRSRVTREPEGDGFPWRNQD